MKGKSIMATERKLVNNMGVEKVNTTDKAAAATKRKTTAKGSAKKSAEAIEEEKKNFQKKLIALKELAKNKKNVLELTEINNFLSDIDLDE